MKTKKELKPKKEKVIKEKSIEILFHIPTQQYGFCEVKGDDSQLEKMEKLYNKYAENPLIFSQGKSVKVRTFTGEEILYDKENHVYYTLKGEKMLSASGFKSQFSTPFDSQKILSLMKEKYGIEPHILSDIWSTNGEISRSFGNVIHLCMEQYFKHKENCKIIDDKIEVVEEKKYYNLPKHPFLKNVVTSFPLLSLEIIPEIMVSYSKEKIAGQIDGLVVTGKKEGYIIDYKSDADIKKGIKLHFIQMSFYAYILKKFGWNITKVEVWNYTNKWESYTSEVLDITKLKKK